MKFQIPILYNSIYALEVCCENHLYEFMKSKYNRVYLDISENFHVIIDPFLSNVPFWSPFRGNGLNVCSHLY